MGPAPHLRGTGVGRPQRGSVTRARMLPSKEYLATVEAGLISW